MITCRVCKYNKLASEMAIDKRIARGHTTICKKCDSLSRSQYYRNNKRRKQDYDLRRNYGISIEEYDKLAKLQNYRCAICKTTKTAKNKSRFAVDHNHRTNQVRGLLCDTCNQAIGLLKDDSCLLKRAAHYLESFEDG